MSDAERICELEAKVNALEQKLNYDSLTGVFTRQYLFDRFADPTANAYFLIFLDLDDFKSVNDHYGHLAGDQLLTLIAHAVTHLVGDAGFVVRLSGDEFIVVLEEMPEAAFAQIRADIRTAIARTSITVEEVNVARTASLGYITLDRTKEVQQAIDLADAALRQAKLSGKNRAIGYEDRHPRRTPSVPSLDAVRDALRKDEIGYHVQPIFDISGETIEGFEALLRWSRPSGEVIGPAQFLSTMTRAYDAISPPPVAGRARNLSMGGQERQKYISFNISDAFIQQIVKMGTGWIDEVIGNVPNDHIVFEVLETVVDTQNDVIADVIAQLRARGTRVALDDFGTGHSNLKRLHKLDVDFLKIDMRFAHAATQSTRGYDIFASMVDLAHRWGAHSVVEGIETKEQLNIAKQVGAQSVQGFLLGCPRPISDY